ncbi:hypothetical protein ACWENO_36370 [Streptomyces sp. NPDC004436]
MQRAGDHVREVPPGAYIPEAPRLVPYVAFPPTGCRDVGEWVAQYNVRSTPPARSRR